MRRLNITPKSRGFFNAFPCAIWSLFLGCSPLRSSVACCLYLSIAILHCYSCWRDPLVLEELLRWDRQRWFGAYFNEPGAVFKIWAGRQEGIRRSRRNNAKARDNGRMKGVDRHQSLIENDVQIYLFSWETKTNPKRRWGVLIKIHRFNSCPIVSFRLPFVDPWPRVKILRQVRRPTLTNSPYYMESQFRLMILLSAFRCIFRIPVCVYGLTICVLCICFIYVYT